MTLNLAFDHRGNNGNVLSLTDPNNRLTSYSYDPLNRLATVTDPALGLTQYGYDTHDNLTSVTDPRSLTTLYAYNGLNDQTQLASPDTGGTQYSRDSAGNLSQATDARNKIAVYSYDGVGRVTQIQYSDQTQAFQYDQGGNGRGRLTQVTDNSGSTSYLYDILGRVQTKTQTVGSQSKTVGYVYTNGQLTSLITPSGQFIGYSYAHGKVSSVTVNGNPVLSQVLYSPFGSTTGWTWGNNTLAVRQYNSDGQLTTIDSAGLSTYTYNADGTIASISQDSSANLGLPTGPTTLAVSATSNRINTSTGTLNRTYTYDQAGNTLSDGSRSFTYNDASRMTSATSAGITSTYLYNALGQRVRKSNSNGTTTFIHDEQGHLLGEYDQNGALIQEIVWLNDIPVATIRTDQGGAGAGVFYIHTDHLNAPSKITRPSDNAVIWRWDHDPFGSGTPNQDPDGNGLQLSMNLRFSGQYADSETGLYYNYFRYYDPATGRYVESDPIGLAAGINTYLYAAANPISNDDPLGLDTYMCMQPLHALPRWMDSGNRSVADVPGNLLYHQFICVPDGHGKMVCGGQDRGDNGQGKPSQDTYKPEKCEKVEDDNQCVEQCLLKEIGNPNRPPYWLVGGGSGRPGVGMNCQQWADQKIDKCKKECKKK